MPLLVHKGIEAPHHQRDDEEGHHQNHQRQQHDHRVRQLEGGMDLRQQNPDRQGNQPGQRQLAADVGGGEQQALGEESRRYQ